MKRAAIVLLALVIGFSCKKNEKSESENPAPVTPANGTLNFTITSYDSLGQAEAKTPNTSISLAGTAYSAACDSNGKASFSLPSGNYAPNVIRAKHEGAPFNVSVSSGGTTNATSFVARNSPFTLQFAGGGANSTGNVSVSMNVNPAIPAGKSVKVAVLCSSQPGLSVSSYSVINEIYLTQNSNSNYNVCTGAIQSAVNQIPNGGDIYLLAVPVTYGNYYSNILGKNILIGDNLPLSVPTATIKLTKNW
jgi:hypothetical protein